MTSTMLMLTKKEPSFVTARIMTQPRLPESTKTRRNKRAGSSSGLSLVSLSTTAATVALLLLSMLSLTLTVLPTSAPTGFFTFVEAFNNNHHDNCEDKSHSCLYRAENNQCHRYHNGRSVGNYWCRYSCGRCDPHHYDDDDDNIHKDPTRHPTPAPTKPYNRDPTRHPTPSPTRSPNRDPTRHPTPSPTRPHTNSPTRHPTPSPTRPPNRDPTRHPTPSPARPHTNSPTRHPTPFPTKRPTPFPTKRPTPSHPTRHPTPSPTKQPTPSPTKQCTKSSITVDQQCYEFGDIIRIHFTNCDAHKWDWIGLFNVNDHYTEVSIIDWFFLCDSKSYCTSYKQNGTIEFYVDKHDFTSHQEYIAVLFGEDTYKVKATSDTFDVKDHCW